MMPVMTLAQHRAIEREVARRRAAAHQPQQPAQQPAGPPLLTGGADRELVERYWRGVIPRRAGCSPCWAARGPPCVRTGQCLPWKPVGRQRPSLCQALATVPPRRRSINRVKKSLLGLWQLLPLISGHLEVP
jgi:hypothetical protein